MIRQHSDTNKYLYPTSNINNNGKIGHEMAAVFECND